MKRIKKHIHLLLLVLLVSMASCEDFALGEKFLQKPPSSDITIDTIFSTAKNAEKILWFSYSKLPYGFPTGYNYESAMYYGVIEGLTDLSHSTLTWDGPCTIYYTGNYNANTERSGATKYRMDQRGVWQGIRNAWILINNIDRVPDMSEKDKLRMKAEAKIIIGLQYSEMLRHFGALPIVDHAMMPDEPGLPARGTLQETVDLIVRMFDEAIACQELPWAIEGDELTNWSGRLTRASAMGLKVRTLLFAASPLFNNEQPYYEGEASDKLMTWFGGYDPKRWEAAAQAAKDFFDENAKQGNPYQLVQASTSGTYRQAFQDAYYTRGTTESLVSVRRHHKTNNIGALMQSMRWGAWGPTKELFDMFPMIDGTDFDWNNPIHRQNPFINRDPRLCETILLDGDDFHGEKADVVKEYSKDKENYPKGKHWQIASVSLDNNSLNNGIAVRKFALDRTNEYKNRVIQWSYLRLAEIYLSYAEALNECGRTGEAYQYINAVRNRVGLPGLVLEGKQDEKTEFREAILRERACEFAWEEVRFFDLIRWKREADFTKHLHGLNVYRHKTTGEYIFDFPQLKERSWQKTGGFSAKWYLSAFSDQEVNKGYGLIQNPGW